MCAADMGGERFHAYNSDKHVSRVLRIEAGAVAAYASNVHLYVHGWVGVTQPLAESRVNTSRRSEAKAFCRSEMSPSLLTVKVWVLVSLIPPTPQISTGVDMSQSDSADFDGSTDEAGVSPSDAMSIPVVGPPGTMPASLSALLTASIAASLTVLSDA